MTQALIDDLERRMAQAVVDEDFEAAGKLRDEISRLRRHVMIAGDPENPPQASYFKRQVPGRMGLGTAEEAGPDDQGPFEGRAAHQGLRRGASSRPAAAARP